MKRFKHSLSHYRLLTGDMGQLLPVGCMEVLPGDTFQHQSSALVRVSPLLAPVMHPVQVRLHHWFVPNRLVWDQWEDFITGESNFQIPQYTIPNSTPKTTMDYLGVPPVEGMSVNSLPLRAYNLIYDEYYRDQDLVDESNPISNIVKHCAWEKDYFTSARPWPQKGDDITLPLGNKAPITGIGQPENATNQTDELVNETGGGQATYANAWSTATDLATAMIEEDPDNPGHPNIYADLSATTALNVNDMRKAFALQRYQEARARYGSRYTEYLRYLGVRSSDARLQRPEYLGGGRQTISFSEVLQTAPDDSGPESSFVGDLKGHGIAGIKSKRYRRFFEEHGYVITLMSVRPKSIYTNAVNRKWTRLDKEDFYQKELETIGQQAIKNKEIFATADPSGEETFGYADRYREYREENSLVSAEFRDLLNYWHLSREFESQPVLNSSFTDCIPTKRIHAEQTQNSLWIMVNHSVQARRMVNKSAHARIV